MIFTIALKELREIVREGRFRVATLIILPLMVIAVWLSMNYYREVQQQHAAANQSAREIWENQGEKNPHSAAHYGTYAFKPKYPLSLIDPGVDKFTGISIFLEAHRRNEAQYMAAQDQTGLARFGDLTPDFILLFIIPLLIVLFGFNGFSREKEQGTLALLKSQGLSTFKLALGKWLGAYLPILMLTVPLFLIAGIFLSTLQDFGRFSWGELLVLMTVYLVYYAILTNISLIVSALSKNSGISLLIMLIIWITSCLAAPKLANMAAESFYPYPSRQAFEASVRIDLDKGLDGHAPFSEEAKKLEESLLAQYGVDTVSKLPFNFDGYLMQKGEEYDAQVFMKHYNLLKEQYQNQTRLYKSSAIVSPFLPVRFLSMAIARTDYDTHWNFADAADKYRVQIMDTLNMNMAYHSNYGDWEYLASPELWKSVPDFAYNPPSLLTVLDKQLSNLIILMLWLSVSFAALFALTPKL